VNDVSNPAFPFRSTSFLRSFQYSSDAATSANPFFFGPCAIDRSKSQSLPLPSAINACTLFPSGCPSLTLKAVRTHDEKLFTHMLPTNHPPPDSAET
jgi:hypothetical protein